MKTNTVFTVTLIDLNADESLGIWRTPLITTQLEKAVYAVKNNEENLSDSGDFQYAVIEETFLDSIRPTPVNKKYWFKYNSVTDEFEECLPPKQFIRVYGFGIG